VFHVLNRSVARLTLFEKPDDYDAFLRVVGETWELVPLPIFALVVMPNHWHFVVRPTDDEQVSNFFRRLALTHTMRWHAHYGTSGTGHVYQGRFKCFPVQSDEHLLTVMRYVERNPLRANLCKLAEDWRWGTALLRRVKQVPQWLSTPTDPPLPRQWRSHVNQPQTEAELNALRNCIRRGSPFGDERWIKSSVARLGLETTLRPRGRPRKES
jgi:putative transposase